MMNSVDILLLKPGSQKQLYGELSSFQLTAIEPPLWAALLASLLREQGYSVVLLDAEAENWDYQETAEKVLETKPTLVAVVVSGTNPSASTMNMTGAGAVLSHLKEVAPEVKTLLMGLHPSALPERTLKEEKADFVCQGEGIYSLPLLLVALKAGEKEYPIEGIWYGQNGRVISNQRAPLVKNLDRLPMPAWDLLPMKRYRAHNWHCFDDINGRQPYAVLYTSLGCPYKCSFCCINSFFGTSRIRYRSPDKVIEEIDFFVKNYGIRNIKVLDEMFVLNESHVTRICDLIIERGYDLNLWAYARVNTVKRGILRKMKQAGFSWVAYGFESGTRRVLKGVAKGYDIGTVDQVVKMTREEGIYICGNYLFGLPEDDLDSMQKTLDMALGINAEWANLYSAMAYPGSELYQWATQEGWPLPGTWQGYSQHAYETLPLPTKYMTGQEVLRFRDRAFQAYFTNKRYLDMISHKFGPETAAHIRAMASHRINRKYATLIEPKSN